MYFSHREREIEERLRKQEEEARRGTEDKEKWGPRRVSIILPQLISQ